MFEIQSFTGADGFPLKYGKFSTAKNDAEASSNERALLFIPGLGGSVKGALDFLALLHEDFNPIYGPDVRGFGLNPVEKPLTAAKGLIPDLESFYDQVIAPQGHRELALCGISLGGVLATLLATKYPERFSKLILLAPAFKPHPKTFTLSYTLINTFAFLLKGGKAMTRLPYGLEALTTNPAILTDPQYTDHPPLELNSGFLLGVRDLCNQAMSDIRKLTVPTMVVVPGQDVVCDPAAMRSAYERIPTSTPKVCLEYPELYHDVLFEVDHPQIAEAFLGWPSADYCASRSASLSLM
jgi:alpha-beta hydrolase superfamily lysophospholipase